MYILLILLEATRGRTHSNDWTWCCV